MTTTFVELAVGVPLGIFTVFLAIRLWSYAYFKSKWEQFERKLGIMRNLL